MEPMNGFLTTHRQEFKLFVDQICDISSDHATSAIPPSYATPITILGRLPGTSREGFPSLPYLIDQARECASLVDVWLDARHDIDENVEWSPELRRFDRLCEESREKAKQCLTRAEQAERPSGILEPKWEELVEQMQRKARIRETNGHASPNSPAMLMGSATMNSSTSSFADGYFPRHNPQLSRPPPHASPGLSNLAFAISPHLSPDEATSEDFDSETTNTPPGSSSGVWDPGQSPQMADLPSESDDGDPVCRDDGLERSSDVMGSSIYSLTPVKSKRDSAATAKAVPVATPISSPGSQQKKPPRSAYSLRHSSERADISKALRKSNSQSKPDSINGERTERPTKSLYRLNKETSSAADSSASLDRKSPAGRDLKGIREGVFGGVFRKKTKERDKEDAS